MNASETLTAKLQEALGKAERHRVTLAMGAALIAVTEAAQQGVTLTPEHHVALHAVLMASAADWLSMIFGDNVQDRIAGGALLEQLRPVQPAATKPDFDAIAGSIAARMRPLLEAEIKGITDSYRTGKIDHDSAFRALRDLGANETLAVQVLDSHRQHRTLIRVIATNDTEMTVFIPSWSTIESVTVPREQFDETVLPWIAIAPDTRFLAYVNIGAQNKTNLRFDRWEIAPEPKF